jgi:hypothetical protein
MRDGSTAVDPAAASTAADMASVRTQPLFTTEGSSISPLKSSFFGVEAGAGSAAGGAGWDSLAGVGVDVDTETSAAAEQGTASTQRGLRMRRGARVAWPYDQVFPLYGSMATPHCQQVDKTPMVVHVVLSM